MYQNTSTKVTKNQCVRFFQPAHQANTGLVDIYSPVIATVDLVLIHVNLLIKHMLYQPIDPLIPMLQRELAGSTRFNLIQHLFNSRDVSLHIP